MRAFAIATALSVGVAACLVLRARLRSQAVKAVPSDGITLCIVGCTRASACLSVDDTSILVPGGDAKLLKDIDPQGGPIRVVPIPHGFAGKLVAGMRALLHGGTGLSAPVNGSFLSVIDRRTANVTDLAMEDGSHVSASAMHELLVYDEDSRKYVAKIFENIRKGNVILKVGGKSTKVSETSAGSTPKIVQSYITTPVGFLVGSSGVLIPPFGEPPPGSEDFMDLDTTIDLADAWAPHRESLKKEHPCLFHLLGPEWQGRSVMTEMMYEFLEKHPFEADSLDENPEKFMEHINEHRKDFASGLLEHCPEEFK